MMALTASGWIIILTLFNSNTFFPVENEQSNCRNGYWGEIIL